MLQGEFVFNSIWNVDVYYDIDTNAKTITARPMVICVLNKGSKQQSSTTRVWNFVSKCRAVGSISLDLTLVSINIAALRRGPVKGKR